MSDTTDDLIGSAWGDPLPMAAPKRVEKLMTPAEAALAADIYEAMMRNSRHSVRGQQSADFRVGISDLGYCSERTRRMLDHQEPEDTDLLAAFIGTAIGAQVEEALAQAWPDAIIQSEVVVPLHGDGGTYNVWGHPDVLRPNGLVLDGKTDRGLNVVRRTGPNQQQQFQRHCYAKGAWLGGFFPGVALEDVMVGNVWVDRAADEKELHVHLEPYDERVVEAATLWLDDVIYAFLHKQDARKEPAREVCEATCGFYGDCRALDTDVTGLLSDEVVLTAVDMYQDGAALEREGKRLKDQAKAHLNGIQGSTGDFTVRWVHVNGSHVSYDRSGYEKLDVRRIK